MMNVITRPLGPVQANCYLLMENGHAILIDPGDVFLHLKDILKENVIELKQNLDTAVFKLLF